MTMDEITLDELRPKLCKGEYSHLHLTWNDDSGANYWTVKDAIEHSPDYYPDDSFVGGEAGKTKCIEANSIWTAHWYPDTPVGFCVMHASTATELLLALDAMDE